MTSTPARFAQFRALARGALAYTLLVILWGAYVRASGSGAGCGSHWPTCNGELVPRAPAVATMIELTHRITSGLALPLVIVLAICAFRWLPRGHVGRAASVASVALMVTEAAIGAGLVLFEMVAHDASLARGAWMSAHLINTFFLLGAMAVTAFCDEGGATPRLGARPRAAPLLVVGLGAMLLTGVTGAIAALGDTLFPARSFAEGLAHDAAPGAHLFVQLRVLHPFVAAGAAVILLIVSASLTKAGGQTERRATWVGAGVLGQVALGVVNLALAAPTAMQLVHLLGADLVWIALVALTTSALTPISDMGTVPSTRPLRRSPPSRSISIPTTGTTPSNPS